MRQTEIYVEQVIIGFCVLVIVDVLLTGRVPQPSDKGLLTGAIVIGASYVVGILYDRCADSLLERFDRWNRIRFAVRGTPDDHMTPPAWPSDPFPQFSRKLSVKEEAAYLKSRLRLMRAMTTLVPAMTIAVLVARASFFPRPCPLVLIATVGMYFLVALLSREEVPRTDDKNLTEYVRSRRRTPHEGKIRLRFAPGGWTEPAVIGWFLLSAEAIAIAAWSGDWPEGFVIAVAGMLLTLLVAWSWVRISYTFMSLLRSG